MGKDRLSTSASAGTALEALNALDHAEAEAAFLRCCGAPRWARTMERMRPFHSAGALADAARDVWRSLTPLDWRQAFAAHPRIGAHAGARSWSAGEQAAVAAADDDVLVELAGLNAEYEARFGHIFIVCASGRSAESMLADLNERIENAPADELRIAAGEQEKITLLRLQKLLTELGDG